MSCTYGLGRVLRFGLVAVGGACCLVIAEREVLAQDSCSPYCDTQAQPDDGALSMSATVAGANVGTGSLLHSGDTIQFDGVATATGGCAIFSLNPELACVFNVAHYTTVNHIHVTVTLSTTYFNNATFDVGSVFGMNPDGTTAFRTSLSTGSGSTGPVREMLVYGAGSYTFHFDEPINDAFNLCFPYCPPSPVPDPTAPDVTVYVDDANHNAPDLGAPPCNSRVGEPINVTTGNVFLEEDDFERTGGLHVRRAYNSLRTTTSPWSNPVGAFGNGWSSDYEEAISALGSNLLRLDLGSGQRVYFGRSSGVSSDPFLPIAPSATRAQVLQAGGGWQLRWFDGNVHNFNSAGHLTTLIDRNNNTTTIAYDGSNRLSTATDPWGHVLTYHYSGTSALVSSLSDATGTIASYQYPYSFLGWLSEVDYADGSKLVFTYDWGTYKLLTVKDGLGNLIESHTYDSSGRALTSQRDGGAGLVNLNYVSNSETDVTDALGKVSVFKYNTLSDGHRVVTSVTGGCGCGASDESRSWTYDPAGRELSFTDGLGDTTQKTYDSQGNLLSVTDPLSHTHSYDLYNAFGEPGTITDPLGNMSINLYDGNGNLVATQDPAGDTYSYAYDPKGSLSEIQDPRGGVTWLLYDVDGNLYQKGDPLGNVTAFAYDSRGRLVGATDPLNQVTSVVRDAMGRVSQVTLPNGGVYAAAYDASGRLHAVTDPNGHVTTENWDAAYRLQSKVDPANGTVTCGYDSRDALSSITDERGSRTQFIRDGLGRLRTLVYPNGGIETFGWDAAGRLQTKVDRRGITTTFLWDAAGQLLGKTYSDSTPPLTIAYYANGKLRTASTSVDTLTWTYDSASRLLSETSLSNDSMVGYAWDAAGNRTQLALNATPLFTYGYDAANRPTSVVRVSSGATYGFGYDPASRRTSQTYPNGVSMARTFNALDQVATIVGTSGTGVVANASYTFDPAGNRQSATLLEYSETYQYDAKDQIQQAVRGSTVTEAYTWDVAGNRTSALNSPGWVSDVNNELTSAGAAALTYDANGNVLQKTDGNVTWQYTWDAENRLLKVQNSQVSVEFSYDPLGRRAWKTVGDLAGTYLFNTAYVYDGQDVLQEIGGATSTVSTYTHGPGIDEPLTIERSSRGTSYYHADAVGSIIKMTDPSGAVTGTRAYDTFGVPSGTTDSGWAYAGRPWDAEVGLYYDRARYYDPALGRFLSEDPAGFEAGTNFYAYVGNNPLLFTDPSGRDPWAIVRLAKGAGTEIVELISRSEALQALIDAFKKGVKGGAQVETNNPDAARQLAQDYSATCGGSGTVSDMEVHGAGDPHVHAEQAPDGQRLPGHIFFNPQLFQNIGDLLPGPIFVGPFPTLPGAGAGGGA
jgi:RHS repeat-associated protein